MPVSGWITLFVVMVVGGRIIWSKIKERQRDEIAVAFGQASLPAGKTQASHDGKQITFVKIGDQGPGIFLQDLATGQNRLIHQKGAEQDIFLNLAAWPWSPDDRYFIYTAEDLVVCEAKTGKELAKFSTDGHNNIANLVWLGNDQFIYVNRQGSLHLIQNQQGEWRQQPRYGSTKIGTQNLTALSKNIVVWQKGNRIWSLNLARNESSVIYEQKTGKLNGFGCSTLTGQWLLSCSENGTNSLWFMKLGNNPSTNQIHLATDVSIHDVAWLEPNKGGYAYLSVNSHHPDQNFLMIKPDLATEPMPLEKVRDVSSFTVTAHGQQLLFTGSISNELAAGIWRYDLLTKVLQPVVPCTDDASAGAVNVEPMHGILNVAGRKVDYYIYPPADFNRHATRKYPVILGNTLYHALDPVYQNRVQGPLWASALARCGAYVVIIERPGFWFNGINQWPENIMAMHQKLLAEPTIDSHQVYLFATSAETQYLNPLLEKQPQSWAGLMIFNGAAPSLGHFAKIKSPPRFLITAGALEHNENNLKRFQSAALQMGMATEVVIHPDSAHVLMGKEPLTQKNRAIARFIFNE